MESKGEIWEPRAAVGARKRSQANTRGEKMNARESGVEQKQKHKIISA